MVIRGRGGVCRVSRRRDAEGTRLVLKGSLDAGTNPLLRPMLERVAADEGRNLRIDLLHLKLLDATGLRTLVSLQRAARARGALVHLIGAHGQPLAMLRLMGLVETFVDVPPPDLGQATARAS
jgi:anti-anti-sigma factor